MIVSRAAAVKSDPPRSVPPGRRGALRIVLAGLGVALAAPAAVRSQVIESTKKFAKGLLWRVTGRGVRPSYVFGTLHVVDPRVLDVPEAVGRALLASRYYCAEGVQGDREAVRIFEAAQLADGRTLEELIGAPAYSRAADVLRARRVPEEAIPRVEPWAVLITLMAMPREYDYEKTTLDLELLELARENGLRVIALDSVEDRIAVFDRIPLETQVRLLRHALAHRDELSALIEPTVEAWLRRDLAGVHAAGERVARRFPEAAGDYRVLFRAMLEDRSVVMARRLAAPLREGGVFVAVGAGRLYGANGLLALIERQGYRVERVY